MMSDNQKLRKILVIDDEETIVELLGMALPELGFEFVSASTGNQAIDIIKKDGKEFEWVILDMKLPDLDGDEVFEKIIEEEPKIKVVISSGRIVDSKIKSIIKSENAIFMAKPYSFEELKKVLERR